MPVHERAALLKRPHVVVVAQAAVAGEAGGGALVTAVHGNEVDVDVDEEVALRRPLADLDLLLSSVVPRNARLSGSSASKL